MGHEEGAGVVACEGEDGDAEDRASRARLCIGQLDCDEVSGSAYVVGF